jgi:hypothetical protein
MPLAQFGVVDLDDLQPIEGAEFTAHHCPHGSYRS